MPDPKTHADERPWLEQLLRRLPGFKGYLEKSYRRDSDTLQRKYLCDRIERSKRGLDAYTRQLADEAKLESLPECDRLRAKLDRLIARTRGAMPGYSGIFDLVQVNEAMLERVYERDVALGNRVETLARAVEQLQTGALGVTIASLSSQTVEVEQALDDREDLLKGLQ